MITQYSKLQKWIITKTNIRVQFIVLLDNINGYIVVQIQTFRAIFLLISTP